MTNKCAHPACSCTVPEGKMYCSDKCATGNPSDLTRPPQARQDAPLPEAKCGCEHLGCKGPIAAAFRHKQTFLDVEKFSILRFSHQSRQPLKASGNKQKSIPLAAER